MQAQGTTLVVTDRLSSNDKEENAEQKRKAELHHNVSQDEIDDSPDCKDSIEVSHTSETNTRPYTVIESYTHDGSPVKCGENRIEQTGAVLNDVVVASVNEEGERAN